MNFVFSVGDLEDGALSVAVSVKAADLAEAKNKLTDLMAELKEPGGVSGVVPICVRDDLRFHVRIMPEAVADDNNWDED